MILVKIRIIVIVKNIHSHFDCASCVCCSRCLFFRLSEHTQSIAPQKYTPLKNTDNDTQKTCFQEEHEKAKCVQISNGSPNHATHIAQCSLHFAAVFIVVRTKTSILKPSRHTPTHTHTHQHTQTMTLRKHDFNNNQKSNMRSTFKWFTESRNSQCTLLIHTSLAPSSLFEPIHHPS